MESKNRSKTVLVLLLIGIVVVGSLLAYGQYLGVTGNVVNEGGGNDLVIGAILPLTGDLAVIGIEAQKGMELAREELEEEFNIDIIYEDDGFIPSESVNAANKLINFDNIDVGLSLVIEEAKPATPIFENNKIPLLIVWDSTNFVKQSDYLFSTGFSTEIAGESMADYAYNNLGLRNIVIVAHNEAWAEVISKSFEDKFESLGGRIIFHEKQDISEKDYRSTILKMKESEADGAYIPLLPPNSVNFLLQAEQLDLDVQLLQGDALFQEVIVESGQAAEGIYYTNTRADDAEILRQKYIKKYGEEPLDITLVSFGYNGIKTILEAYQINARDLRKGLVELIGADGSLERIERIYHVENGESVLVG